MNRSNYDIFLTLKKYYKENCKQLIFVGEKKLANYNYCKMYFLNVTNIEELLNYKKVFQEYLALYVRNYDKLTCLQNITETTTDDELSVVLKKHGKIIWDQGALIITSSPDTLGIYGELFDEFYLNIVKEEKILISYSVKNTFNARNIKGVDTISAIWEDNSLTIILSECKFVANITAASSSLREDIVGTTNEKGHLTKEYINRYLCFTADKNHSLFSDDESNKKIIEVYNDINSEIINGMLPIDALNKYNVKIRFDYFALYTDNKFTPEERKEKYLNIVNAFNQNIKSIGLKRYDMEVIFIPTINKSTLLKKELSTWD